MPRTKKDKKMEITEKHLVAWIRYRIKPSFPSCPEGALACAVIMQAVEDATGILTKTRKRDDVISAIEYLMGDMRHASIAGVDADWVKEIMRDCGLMRVINDRYTTITKRCQK